MNLYESRLVIVAEDLVSALDGLNSFAPDETTAGVAGMVSMTVLFYCRAIARLVVLGCMNEVEAVRASVVGFLIDKVGGVAVDEDGPSGVDVVRIHTAEVEGILGSVGQVEMGGVAIGMVVNGLAIATKDESLARLFEGWSEGVAEGLKKVFGSVVLFVGRVARAMVALLGQDIVKFKAFHVLELGNAEEGIVPPSSRIVYGLHQWWVGGGTAQCCPRQGLIPRLPS